METETRKISNLHVSTIEEEIYLIQESEKRWWETDAKVAYLQGLDFINNLKI
jgi:hypothetical protein